LAAFDPWHLVFSHYALTESSMVLFVVAAAAAVLLPAARTLRQGLLVGLLAGGICLIRPTGQVWVPFLALAYLARGPWQLRELKKGGLALLLGLALSAGPWLAFNFSRGIRGFAVSEDPILFQPAAYHRLLDPSCMPAGTQPEVRAAFERMSVPESGERQAFEFLETCKQAGVSWADRAAWSRDSVRADPPRYLRAVWHTLLWQLHVGSTARPPISDELAWFCRRLTLDGRAGNNQAPNFQGAFLKEPLLEKFRMEAGRADSLAGRFFAPWGGARIRGVPQLPLAILALGACLLCLRRRRHAEALILAGSLVFVAVHALILYPWQRYSLPSEMIWYLSLPILVAALTRRGSRRTTSSTEVLLSRA
jgi:hypothetical protein